MLMEAILDYMRWIKSLEEQRGTRSDSRYTRILIDFLIYVIHKGILWEEIFTLATLEAFRTYSGYKGACRAIRALSDYLFSKGRIDQPLDLPKPQPPLPDIYKQYLRYHKQSLQVSDQHAKNVRRVLTCFHEYLKRHQITLSALKIEHLDAFMGEFDLALSTRRVYRHHLRGFLKYLYHEGGIIKKDFATLLVGPPMFAQPTPPKFLRPEEVKKLFSSLKISTPADIRTYAIVHLTYTLGLRPVEITRITFDDISFSKGVITLRERKADNPITLPVPENTLKAVALYAIKVRPKSHYRHLFLTFHLPYRSINSGTVGYLISKAMKKAGLNSSPHWLRHTYAQNLLETGGSIYEIKEMLGHQSIQSSHRYIYIHTELMRKVLFNETL
jgi:site-specific recombinase XerD